MTSPSPRASGAAVQISGAAVFTAAAPPEVADRLGIRPGAPVTVRTYTVMVGGAPAAIACTYLAGDLARIAGAEQIADPARLHAQLAAAGHAPAAHTQTLTLRPADAEEAIRLDLAPGAAVLDVDRLTCDARGRPVEWVYLTLAHDRLHDTPPEAAHPAPPCAHQP